MSVNEVTFYTVTCDHPDCTISTQELNDEYAAWSDASQAVDDWGNHDGSYVNGKAYCPDHATSFCRECGTAESIKEDGDGWFRCPEHLEGKQ